jgi:hypothetical protein
LSLARSIEDKRGEGIWLLNLGLALDEQGRRDTAIAQVQAAEQVLREVGHPAAGQAGEWLARWQADA